MSENFIENYLNFELERSATGKKLLCCAVQTGFLCQLLPFPSQKGSESCNIFIHLTFSDPSIF